MLVFWGDSIWAGPPECGYVPRIITELVNAHVVPMAIGGATSSDTLATMRRHPQLLKGTAIISMGRCNLAEPKRIVADWRRVVSLLGHDRWFAVPLPKTSPRGTEKFDCYEAIDSQVKALAGDRFLDTHAALGAIDGMVPASLMHDPVHCNRAGNLLTAQFLAAELIRRNLVAAKVAQAAA